MSPDTHRPFLDVALPRDVPGAPRTVPGLLPRTRFIEWMAATGDVPVRMICGGAGYGKTSALLSWLARRDDARGPTIWITLDDSLKDRAAFWLLAIHQLRRAGMDVDPQLEPALRGEDGLTNLLPSLLVRQFESAGDALMIVDNGDLAADTDIADDLIRLVTHVPGLRTVVTTRAAPGTTHAEEALGRLVSTYGAGELALDADEITRMAELAGHRLDPTVARRLRETTHGWPLAVRAELMTLEDRGPDDPAQSGAATRALGTRLLDRFRADPGFALLRRRTLSPTIPSVDLEPELQALLVELAEVGLGWWEFAPFSQFRLQPVLRTLLRSEFEAEDPRAAQAEHLAIAEFHLARDEYSPAFGSALRAEAWALAARIYVRHLLSITSRPSTPLLSSHRVPYRGQLAEPVLALAVAIDDFANRRRARAVRGLVHLIQRVERSHPTGRRVSVEDVWTQGVLTMARRLLGRHEAARASLRRVHRMLERVHDPAGELDRALSLFLSQGALVALLADDAQYADVYLAEAGITPLPQNSAIEEARLHGIRALVSVTRGAVDQAIESLEARSRLPLPDDADRSYTALPAMLATARVHLEQADPRAAARALSATDGHAATTDLWPLLVQCTVRVRWHLDGPTAALELLDEELEAREGRFSAPSVAIAPLTILRAALHLADSRIDAARTVIAESPRHRSHRFQLIRARLDLADGQYERAAARAAIGAGRAQMPADRQAFALVAAAAALHTGERSTAEEHVAAAARLARVHGVLTPFTLIPRCDAEKLLADQPELAAAVSRFTTFPVETGPIARLTPRETIVLHELVEQSPVSEIAQRLAVSENTVKSQLRSLYRKLGVGTRSDALDEARRQGLL